ncbi:Poly(A) polymerase [Aphelenchoides fujianensis]|nr:Poly(A) polymerase [Aphelenchoides fujianensis]
MESASHTEDLVACLNSFNLFENDEELQKRLDVLRRINSLVRTWVRRVSEGKGADIDSLCVVPRHVDRAEFFKSFYEMLAQDDNVTDLHSVPDAFVPLIKLKYCDIEIDILFARLALKEVPDTQELADDNLLRNLDEKSIRSLNGCRVADQILRLIPNKPNFMVTLRALYPFATPAVLLQKFFLLFAAWEWPHPVLLHDSDSPNRTDIPGLREMVWDPRSRMGDRFHLMPVITPAYPEQNSTFNVTNSTKAVITDELTDALELTCEVMAGKAKWDVLFEEVNFFSRYRHFLTVLCISETEKDHLVFAGLVESKIRHLIGNLERNEAINMCHINPRQFKPRPEALAGTDHENSVCTFWFLGLDLKKELKKNVDLNDALQTFTDTVNYACTSTGVQKDTMRVQFNYLLRKELTKWVTEEEIMKSGRRAMPRKRNSTGSTTTLLTEAIKRPAAVEDKVDSKKMRMNESTVSV